MHKVLVVEDEKTIRKGLVYTFDWQSLDCAVVAEAENGAEGATLIRKLNPDIVITDIKMPIMDGLSMIAQTSLDYGYESIIVSGYGEFEYARKAIDYGVTQYLLKPIEEGKMIEALRSAIVKIEKKKDYSAMERLSRGAYADAPIDPAFFSGQTRSNASCVQQTADYIVAHYAEKISLEVLCEAIGASSTYLNRRLKEETGHTFGTLLNDYRIRKAIELLVSTDDRIYEIAAKTGFESYKYFSLVFKKYVGCAPMEFARTGSTLRQRTTASPSGPVEKARA
jgi:two-component system response regulator YesN